MHSQKFGVRPDTRNRSHRSANPDNRAPKNHHEITEASKVSPLQVAARVTNLRLLLEKAGGDIPTFAGRAEVSLEDLRQILEGQKVVGDERATHIELTLELGQGWLDKKHEISDISPTTVDILLGKDVSTFEKEIRNSELKGHEIMKNTASTAASTTSSAPATSAAKAPAAQNATSDKASNEIVEARIANLTLLTQARGAKSRLARLLGVSESIVSFLFSRSKEFTNSFTRNLESLLALPEMWMDTVREIKDVPQEAWDKLGSAAAVKGDAAPKKGRKSASDSSANGAAEKSAGATAQLNAPAAKADAPEVPRGQRVHRLPRKSDAAPQQSSQQSAKPNATQGTLTLQLRPSAAPSVLLGDNGGLETLPELESLPPADQPSNNVSEPAPQAAATSNSAPAAEQSGAASTELASTPSEAAGHPTKQVTVSAAPDAAASTPAPSESGSANVPKVSVKSTARASAAKMAAETAQPPVAPAVNSGQEALVSQLSAKPADSGQLVAQPANPSSASAESARGQAPHADVLELSTLFLSPITEALLKTLAIKAKEGVFSEKDALRLLTEIVEL